LAKHIRTTLCNYKTAISKHSKQTNYKKAAQKTKFFRNYRKNKISMPLRQPRLFLLRIAKSDPKKTAACKCNKGLNNIVPCVMRVFLRVQPNNNTLFLIP